MSAATVGAPLVVRLGVKFTGLGTFGKDLWRGARIIGGIAGIVLLVDVVMNMMGRLAPGMRMGPLLGATNFDGVIDLVWLVTGYTVGLALTCEEEESGMRTLLEQLPIPLQHHFWMKALAGTLLSLLFLPILLAGYALSRLLVPAETLGVMELASQTLIRLGTGTSILFALGACYIGQSWAVFAKGNGPVAALAGFFTTYAVYMVYFFLSRLSDNYSNINMTWRDVASGLLALGIAELVLASRRSTRPRLDRKGLLESMGIQITITRTRKNSVDGRLTLLPTALLGIVGGGVVTWLLNSRSTAPLPNEDFLSQLASFLAIIGAVIGAVHGAWCLAPEEQEGSRFFLFYQPLALRSFYTRRILLHAGAAALAGGIAALPLLGRLSGTSLFFAIAILAFSAASAGLLVYTCSAAFRLRIISGGLGVVLASAIVLPASNLLVTSRVLLNRIQHLISDEEAAVVARSVTNSTNITRVWLVPLVIGLPMLLAFVLHHVARLREMTEGTRQVVGLLLVVQLILVGPLLALISPTDLWIILFP